MCDKLLSSNTITGDYVQNEKGEDLGMVEDLMIDMDSGNVMYAVLSYDGILGMGDQLYAVPFDRLKADSGSKYVILDADKLILKDAPGFHTDNWPDFMDAEFIATTAAFYSNARPAQPSVLNLTS